jgi:hypothetical protein
MVSPKLKPVMERLKMLQEDLQSQMVRKKEMTANLRGKLAKELKTVLDEKKRLVELSRMMGEDRDAPSASKLITEVEKIEKKLKKVKKLPKTFVIEEDDEEVITPAPASQKADIKGLEETIKKLTKEKVKSVIRLLADKYNPYFSLKGHLKQAEKERDGKKWLMYQSFGQISSYDNKDELVFELMRAVKGDVISEANVREIIGDEIPSTARQRPTKDFGDLKEGDILKSGDNFYKVEAIRPKTFTAEDESGRKRVDSSLKYFDKLPKQPDNDKRFQEMKQLYNVERKAEQAIQIILKEGGFKDTNMTNPEEDKRYREENNKLSKAIETSKKAVLRSDGFGLKDIDTHDECISKIEAQGRVDRELPTSA